MLAILLLALQAPPERTVEEAVQAFAKGDDPARAELLRAGAFSIRPLLKSRERSPERVDALLWDLKLSAAGFDATPLVRALETRRSIDIAKLGFDVAHAELSDGLPLLFDQTLHGLANEVTLRFETRPRREILESLCRQMGLDYGFFYGVVLIAAPDRLWPAGSPPRVAPLTEAESKRARAWVERLSNEGVEEREEAMAALLKLGDGVTTLLEKSPPPADGETAARIRDLILRLRKPPPAGVFHPPAARRQTLDGADLALMKSLEERQVSFKVADINLDGAMRLLLGPQEIRCQLSPVLKETRMTIDLQNVSGMTLLSLALHSSGFDFLIRDGAVVIDRRVEIERQIGVGR